MKMDMAGWLRTEQRLPYLSVWWRTNTASTVETRTPVGDEEEAAGKMERLAGRGGSGGGRVHQIEFSKDGSIDDAICKLPCSKKCKAVLLLITLLLNEGDEKTRKDSRNVGSARARMLGFVQRGWWGNV